MRLVRLVLPAAVALVAAAGPLAAQATSQGAGHGAGHGTPQAAGHGAGHGAAQTPAQGAEWSGDLPAHFEGIALTDAQKTQIAALQKQYHARMDAMRDSAKAAGTPADAPALKSALQRVMTEEHAAFRALLDNAGRVRFDANMAKMHAGEHGAQGGAQHGAGHGAQGGASHGGRPPR
jgi:hypothetical protein